MVRETGTDMKYLFYSLLLFNIIFFLWEFNRPQPTPEAVVENVDKGILLLTEWQIQKKLLSKEKQSLVEGVKKELFSQLESGLANSAMDANLPQSENLLQRAGTETSKSSVEKVETTPVQQELISAGSSSSVTEVLKVQDPVADAMDTDVNHTIAETAINSTESETEQTVPTEASVSSTRQDELLSPSTVLEESDKNHKSENITDVSVDEPKKAEIDLDMLSELNTPDSGNKSELCFLVGPFASEELVSSWGDLNSFNNLSIENKEVEVLSSFLVYLPRKGDFSQSKKQAEALKEQGITDYWLFMEGELRGDISLGLFKKHSRALRLQKKYLNKGFKAEILPRNKMEMHWYGRVKSEDDILNNSELISEDQSILICDTE